MGDLIKISKILVVRNDTTTNWESSVYILAKGEIGIGWWEVAGKMKPIVKVGNGTEPWISLPQNDYMIPEDLILTRSFGKHIVENGSINAGGKGMTMSEWIVDSLRDDPSLEVTPPSFKFVLKKYNTDTGTNEIGSVIQSIEWETLFNPGVYPYGSLNDEYLYYPILWVLYVVLLNGENIWNEEGVPEGNTTVNYIIDSIGEKKYCDFKARASWGQASNIPLNNFKQPDPDKKTQDGSQEVTQDLFVAGYREGCFFGGFNGEITVDKIRSLFTTGANYSQKVIEFTMQPGQEQFLIACPDNYCGPTSIYNTSINAEMLVGDNFTISTLDIPAANGFEPIPYKILSYKPAKAYVNPANIRITLG